MGAPLDLGCFSVSLSVENLERSLAFYESLGFTVIGGEGRWRILGNQRAKIGLFEGEFEGNILTFNPGLSQDWPEQHGIAEAAGPDDGGGLPAPVDGFTDVRVVEQRLVDAGIELSRGTETESGPDHVMLVDPDGNQILIDQFF